MQGYEILDRETMLTIFWTDLQGEADFWASLGYRIRDWHVYVQQGK